MATKDRGIFLLRAVVGLGMLFAGLDKFFMWASGTPFTAAGYLVHATGGAWLVDRSTVTKTFLKAGVRDCGSRCRGTSTLASG